MTSSIRSRKHKAHAYAAAFAALAFAPALAHADSADSRDRPTEVTVKGERVLPTKRVAPLVDTPQTIEVIKSDVIEQQGATTLTEALRNSPGVGTFYLGENGSTSTGDAIYMRGSDVSGSIFVDGVRDVATVSRDMFNIEQVEVLKGGAGTDVGRGAATGAIDLSTKRPLLGNFYNGSVAAGGGDFGRATADLNWQIGDTRAFRLNLMDQDAGVAGRDIIKNKRWGIAPSLGFGLNTPTRLYLDYLHVEQNNIPDGGVSTIGLPGYSAPDDITRAGYRDFLNDAARADPRNFYGTKDDHDNDTTDAFTAIFEHDLGHGLRLSNITRWSQTDQNYQLTSIMGQGTNLAKDSTRPLLTPDPSDPSTWTLTRLVNNKNITNKALTNQTHLQGHFKLGGLQNSFDTGLELEREEQTNRLYDNTAASGAYPAVSIYAPDPNVSGYSRFLTGAYTYGRTDTVGLYANDAVKFSDAWQLNGGLRYDHYKTRFDSYDANGVNTPLSVDGDLWSGRLGLVYKPARNGSIYASYAVTAQPPGGANFTLTSTAKDTNPDVKPQLAKTWEAGSKWNFAHGQLALTGAVYRTQYSDQITQDPDGTLYRTGEKSVQGIELGLNGQITPDWTITAGYTTMHTEVKKQVAVTADGSDQLAYNPTDSLTLWTTYRLADNLPLGGLTLGGGVNYNGQMKRGSDGAIGTPSFTKAYAVVNGLATYPLTPHVELQLNVYNLFDTDYVAAINKSGYRYTPGTPRTVRLTVNFKY
ncbi:catecholate siderophore receptor Fiu [Asticcacaulis sp. EMRT-3]|uniref:catecholate siderophore receptor Fiu n=1 Tax=Asticcacaulis sp. EMRT-3 TaxID=3040349 RepID=UPI0024AF43CC|nr:catecholate siderophore receptor Fiu [Asticcacaulis sp. EMRT-3]MDI7776448.1 catecholate siderophore receptor Fiu [Asticcacaulis sp. EMRT-3]